MKTGRLEMHQQGGVSLLDSAQPIPRLDADSDWSELVRARTPFILTGRTAHWKARSWTFQSFRERYGSVDVLVSRNAADSPVSYDWPSSCHKIPMKCSEFIDTMLAHPEEQIYLWKRNVQQFPGIEEEFHFRDIYYPGGNTFSNVWLSTRGSRSGLHFDRHDNIFAQMSGSKSVFLLPPHEARRIYPVADFIERSRIDPENVDPAIFPRALRAGGYHGVVDEGEILHIPQLWWHYLKALTPSISLNYWYGEAASILSLASMVRKAGLTNVTRVTRDFVWYGVLQRRLPESNRPVPTGKDLYSWVSGGIRRRLVARTPA